MDMMPQMQRGDLVILQLFSMVTIFGLPPYVYARWTNRSFSSYYTLHRLPGWGAAILGALFMVSMYPLLVFLQSQMQQIPLDPALDAKIKAIHAQSEAVMQLFMRFESVTDFLFIVAMVGGLAGLVEELFFRGFVLQGIFRWTRKPAGAIVLSSLLFAIVHIDFYNILPIILIALALGYLYYRSGMLWLNILMHAFYNSLQVIGFYLFKQGWIGINLEEWTVSPSLALGSLTVSVMIYVLLIRSVRR
jgi:hypothetical protein